MIRDTYTYFFLIQYFVIVEKLRLLWLTDSAFALIGRYVRLNGKKDQFERGVAFV